MTAGLSILIADDHQLVRDSLAHLLNADPGVSVAVAESLPETLAAIAANGGYDVVLLDVMMPGMDGLQGVQRTVAANAPRAVVVFSGNVGRGFVDEALALGARGFVPKTLPARSLIHALRLVAGGRTYVPVTHLAEDASPALPPGLRALTPQEWRVLRLLCEGMSNKEIARALALSEVTVKTHMRAICGKLGAKNRTHAAMIATPHLRG